MPAEAINPTEPSTEERNRRLNREVMEMISALTSRLGSLHQAHKPGGLGHVQDEDEPRVSIITLAGTNTGATMRSGPDEKSVSQQWAPPPPPGKPEPVTALERATLVNSNLQAINNSIMLETKYTSHDPGVHMDMEALEPKGHKDFRHGGWKGKRKEEASSSFDSDQHSPGSVDL